MQPFHHAFRVSDLEETRKFYSDTLSCKTGRDSERWIDFDFFGHQITAHLAKSNTEKIHNEVDGDAVPVPHFGVILTDKEFDDLAARLTDRSVEFIIEPHTRFAGQVGEQKTMFFLDPSGNALEFKAFPEGVSPFERE